MGQSGALYKSDVADHKPADANRFMKVGDYCEQQRQALEKTVKQHHTVFVPGSALKVRNMDAKIS